MVQPVLTKAFQQPAKPAGMCMAPRAEIRPPPSIPLYLLTQNLSSKQIAPTDNMQPKSDDAIWHHRLLKVFNIRMLPTEVFHKMHNIELIIQRNQRDYFEVTISLERGDAVKVMTVLPT